MGRNRAIILGVGLTLILSWIIWASLNPAQPTTFKPVIRVITNEEMNSPLNRMRLRPPASGIHRFVRPSAPEQSPLLNLDTAEDTLSTQIALLSNGPDEAFKQTFLPEVRDKLGAKDIDACRQRVKASPVSPDWSKAVASTDGQGRATKQLPLSGAAQTGFHLVDRQWLVDSVWCASP